jgi:hypothetical protein
MRDELTNNDRNAEQALRDMSTDDFFKMLEAASPEQLNAVAKLGQNARVTSPILKPLDALLAAEPRTGLTSIVSWWEARRGAYNVIVGVCGVPTLILLSVYMHASLAMILSGVAGYALLANVCYTIGTPAELLAWMMWRDKSYQVGPVLWTLGTIFSTVLTLGVAFVLLMSLLILL